MNENSKGNQGNTPCGYKGGARKNNGKVTAQQNDGSVEVTRRNRGKKKNADSAGASAGASKSYPPVGTQRTGESRLQGTNHSEKASVTREVFPVGTPN